VDTPAGLNPLLLPLLSFALSLAAIITAMLLYMRQRRLLKRYQALLNGPIGADLEQLLLDQMKAIEQNRAEVQNLLAVTAPLLKAAPGNLQKVGVVRFNAFPDTGSDLSFAIAILDGRNNGVVLSSLFGRSESRIYAKPIQGGISTYPLSDEEREALRQADTPLHDGN
jgi:hypothetical protein